MTWCSRTESANSITNIPPYTISSYHSPYSLDTGAKYQGEFEERLKAVLDEVQSADGAIVLFIDELHTVMGYVSP